MAFFLILTTFVSLLLNPSGALPLAIESRGTVAIKILTIHQA